MVDARGRGGRLRKTFRLQAGLLGDAIAAGIADAERAMFGLWRRDPSVWSRDAAVQRTIANRLGWLSSPRLMAESIGRLRAFAASVKDAGFTDVVLLGMGGSSLAPEVLRAVLGVAPGWPRFQMLDSTDPAAVAAVRTPPGQTLYLFASKSGTTIEPNVLAAHFRAALEQAGVPRWADHFVAITDEGTALAKRAQSEHFRDVFINPSDIGGRYSALSFFGMVPAALMGHDLDALTGWGVAMLAESDPGSGDVRANPAAALGLALGSAARAGRDKLTLLLPPALEPFGLWVEQLVAESTGKNGTGIIPIAGEALTRASVHAPDRMFVRLGLQGAAGHDARDSDVRELKAANAPFAEIELPEAAALGAEFVRWEIGAAIAGAMLHINPFDEPNVQQAKDATRRLLDAYTAQGRLPAPTPDRTADGTGTLTLSAAARGELGGRDPDAILTLIKPGDYLALLAYLGPDGDLFEALRTLRLAVRDRTSVATMFGYGPRYLHSTGQLHKGGPNTGVFIMVTATPREDPLIPREPFSFGTLELAQALGDFASLDAAGRRALHVHLAAPDRAAIEHIAAAMLGRL